MTLEQQLQDAYRLAAERAPVPPGAYDRFLRRRARHGRMVAAIAGLALVAVLGAAVLVARQLPQDRAPATPATTAAEPTPRPHQWVYTKELRVEYGGHKPFTFELWDRVDGKKFARPTSDRRVARAPKVRTERMQLRSFLPSGCPPGQPQRIRPAVGLGHWFPNPSAVPTDAAGRRGVAFSRAAAIEGSGSSGWLRLEIILDSHTYRYLGARHVVTRDHFIPNTPSGSKGTRFRKGQVLVSRAQPALAEQGSPVVVTGRLQQRSWTADTAERFLYELKAGHRPHRGRPDALAPVGWIKDGDAELGDLHLTSAQSPFW